MWKKWAHLWVPFYGSAHWPLQSLWAIPVQSDIIMMDKHHLLFWVRGREKHQCFPGLSQYVEPGSAPTCPLSQSREQLLHPTAHSCPCPTAQPCYPSTSILSTSSALHNLPMSLFLLLLQFSDEASALGKTQLWRNDFALRLQTFGDRHVGSATSKRHINLLGFLLLLWGKLTLCGQQVPTKPLYHSFSQQGGEGGKIRWKKVMPR